MAVAAAVEAAVDADVEPAVDAAEMLQAHVLAFAGQHRRPPLLCCGHLAHGHGRHDLHCPLQAEAASTRLQPSELNALRKHAPLYVRFP